MCQWRPSFSSSRFLLSCISCAIAFMLYRQHFQASVVAQNPGMTNPEISKVIGRRWKEEQQEVRDGWDALAEVCSRPPRLLQARRKPTGSIEGEGAAPAAVSKLQVSAAPQGEAACGADERGSGHLAGRRVVWQVWPAEHHDTRHSSHSFHAASEDTHAAALVDGDEHELRRGRCELSPARLVEHNNARAAARSPATKHSWLW